MKSSISLTEEEHAIAKKRVDAKLCSRVGVVLQQGIDLLRQRMQDSDLRQAALREISGPACCKSVCQQCPDEQDHCRDGR